MLAMILLLFYQTNVSEAVTAWTPVRITRLFLYKGFFGPGKTSKSCFGRRFWLTAYNGDR